MEELASKFPELGIAGMCLVSYAGQCHVDMNIR